ncbi:hypothetical protein KUL42_39310 [Alteromonas sp. KUL42]|nr:hypothetical protein [Alteromonas sp. KUL42]GEA09170.1 hypothetical protein KUL42_39310 [Alteromonas sp. KUL42]
MEMNQYELANAKRLIDGYYLTSPSKPGTNADEFERAKRECVSILEKQLNNVKSLSVNQFFAKPK